MYKPFLAYGQYKARQQVGLAHRLSFADPLLGEQLSNISRWTRNEKTLWRVGKPALIKQNKTLICGIFWFLRYKWTHQAPNQTPM